MSLRPSFTNFAHTGRLLNFLKRLSTYTDLCNEPFLKENGVLIGFKAKRGLYWIESAQNEVRPPFNADFKCHTQLQCID